LFEKDLKTKECKSSDLMFVETVKNFVSVLSFLLSFLTIWLTRNF